MSSIYGNRGIYQVSNCELVKTANLLKDKVKSFEELIMKLIKKLDNEENKIKEIHQPNNDELCYKVLYEEARKNITTTLAEQRETLVQLSCLAEEIKPLTERREILNNQLIQERDNAYKNMDARDKEHKGLSDGSIDSRKQLIKALEENKKITKEKNIVYAHILRYQEEIKRLKLEKKDGLEKSIEQITNKNENKPIEQEVML